MKKELIMKGVFNDVFTNYEDKISNIRMIVDIEKDCECTSYKKCGICRLISQGVLTEINK